MTYTEEEVQNLLLSKQRAVIEAVIAEAEGMRIENPVCYCKTHPEHNCGITSNEAIDDLISRLREALTPLLEEPKSV